MEWFLFIRVDDEEKLVASSPSEEIIDLCAQRMSQQHALAIICVMEEDRMVARRIYCQGKARTFRTGD